jgi:putative DNA-invertase from lambdoid prophage Rac
LISEFVKVDYFSLKDSYMERTITDAPTVSTPIRGTPVVYEETESAWKAGHQRELTRLLDDARKRKFDAVLVWALDRLSREGPLAILSLINRLKICGVRVLSYQESWTEAPGELGELLYAIAGWVARMESQRRSERTKAGLARVVAQGRKLGRPLGSKDKRKRKRRISFN